MPTTRVNGTDLLNAVRKMAPEEFDAFMDQALALRGQRGASTLSAEETRLIKRINRGLPLELRRRSARLIGRRKKGTLTAQEQLELLKLTDETECRDADRAAALVELASLRRLPVRTLMKQMGIKTPPIHG